MAVRNPNPNTTTSTLTAAQTRALLYTLLSTTPNASRPPMAPSRPAASVMPVPFQQPIQQQRITIDASTRIMGHCNNVTLASPSSTEQALMIKESFGGIHQPTAQGGMEDSTANHNKASFNLNVIVQAGVNIIGSKNVVVVNGNGNGNGNKREVTTRDDGTTKAEDAPPPRSSADRKRRAQSEPATAHQTTTLSKKIKVEE